MHLRIGAVLLLALTLGPASGPVVAAAPGAATLYSRALARERELRDEARKPTLQQIRALVGS